MLTEEQMRDALRQCPHDTVENLRVRWLYAKDFARAIESAATAPLLEQIAELEEHAILDRALIKQLHKSMTDAEWRGVQKATEEHSQRIAELEESNLKLESIYSAVPVAWEVYVEEVDHGYVVDDLDDPQLVDDMTNHGAITTPLIPLPERKS